MTASRKGEGGTVNLLPGPRRGRVSAPASKSWAHRLLICAALGEKTVALRCDGISRDIAATVDCLNALGARISHDGADLIAVRPPEKFPAGRCVLPCGESGSTLRFLLPVVGALGVQADFRMEGSLRRRPLAPLDELLRAHGMTVEREGDLLRCGGKLTAGHYAIAGDISSQYISGLLFALPLLEGESTLSVTGGMESEAYVNMTGQALRRAGVLWEKTGNNYHINGVKGYNLPDGLSVEGDWSNAAFFLCMGALSEEGVTVSGLDLASRQGDRAVIGILRTFGALVEKGDNAVAVRRGELKGCTIDAAQIPDLIPTLSVVAAVAEGETRVINAARLRLKESDRLESTAALITALGGQVTEGEDCLTIRGIPSLKGGTVFPRGDHRIAMSAAVAACVCEGPVVVEESFCVEKSYPRFWDDFARLKGGCP